MWTEVLWQVDYVTPPPWAPPLEDPAGFKRGRGEGCAQDISSFLLDRVFTGWYYPFFVNKI